MIASYKIFALLTYLLTYVVFAVNNNIVTVRQTHKDSMPVISTTPFTSADCRHNIHFLWQRSAP